MKINTSTDAKSFLESYGEYLYKNEAKFNLLLGLSEQAAISNPQPNSYIKIEGEGIQLIGMVTPIGNCVLGKLSDEALTLDQLNDASEVLAKELSVQHPDLVGFVGSDGLSKSVAEKYSTKVSKKFRLGMDQMIYENRKVILPSKVEGVLKKASGDDLEMLVQWFISFRDEIEPERKDKMDPRASVETRITNGHAFIWYVESKPVCFVGLARETKTGVTVAPVYTPREFRNRGYGINLTAQVTEMMLARGKRQVNLYTDLSNPTSNSIYKKIGYREVAGSQHYTVG